MTNDLEVIDENDKIACIELKELENKLLFDYNVPQSLEFTHTPQKRCPLCDADTQEYVAKYVASSAPLKDLGRLFYLKFGKIFTADDINSHKKHYTVKYMNDTEIENLAIEDIMTIGSDKITQIDENKVIESQIQQLYATNLKCRQEGNIDKAMEASDKLLKWITLKKKLKDELPKEQRNFMLGDIIHMDGDKLGQRETIKTKGTIDVTAVDTE